MSRKITLKTIRLILLSAILLTLGGGFGYQLAKRDNGLSPISRVQALLVNTQSPESVGEIDFSLFWEVWQKVEAEYVDPSVIDRQKMMYGAIEGMVAALDDPYTVFLPPTEQQRSTEDLAGAFEGVGIQLGYVDSQLAVVAPLKGMPAERAGVQAGDLILHLKDTGKNLEMDTAGMSLVEAVNHIRGKRGTEITLTLFRTSQEQPQPFEVTLARETIVIPSVEMELLTLDNGKKIAHLILNRFGDRTEAEWNTAVETALKDPSFAGVILDMRNNPGGYLDGAIFIASEFIPDGVVVKQQGRVTSQTFSVNRRGRLTNVPVVVLVNKGSASASEIVAGALRDRREAQLIGEKTFGKGTVQNAEELSYGTGLHVTIAKWLLPNGDWIHEDGIPVAIEASNSAETADIDEVVTKALEVIGTQVR